MSLLADAKMVFHQADDFYNYLNMKILECKYKFVLLGIALCFMLGIGQKGWAQAPYVTRVELPVVEGDEPFSVLTLGQFGLVVVMKQNDLYASKPQRSVYFYDENLQQRWVAHLETESEYSFLGYRQEPDSLRFVLASVYDEPDAASFLEIALCLADGRYSKRYHEVAAEDFGKSNVLDFRIQDDAWHMLALRKSRYVYGRLDPMNDTLYEVEIGTTRDYDWCDMALDTVQRNAYVLFRDAKLQEGVLLMKKIAFDGQRAEEWKIESPRKDWRLIDARMQLTGADAFFLGGTWNLDSKRQGLSTYDRGTETAGLFGLCCRRNTVTKFWACSYLDYPAIDTLMSSEELYKVVQARQKAKGRTILPDYLCVPRLEKQDGAFCLTGEVYERIINTTTEVSYDFYGRMMPYTRTEFEGFRYKNAFYSVFDTLGTNVANSVFDIQHDALYMSLQPIASVERDSAHRMIYGYNSEGVVYYRGMSPLGTGSVRSFKLATAYPGDRVLRTWKEGMAEWYPGCFIAYGYQQVQNTRRKGRSRQSVFYINKLVVD